MYDKLFLNNNILEVGMNAKIVENQVIQNNIANVDTPGFKKSVVEFDSILRDKLETARITKKLDLNSVEPRIHTLGYNQRLDESNVDMEVEMANLYEVSMKYEVLASSVMNNYKRINTVLKSQ